MSTHPVLLRQQFLMATAEEATAVAVYCYQELPKARVTSVHVNVENGYQVNVIGEAADLDALAAAIQNVKRQALARAAIKES